MSQRSASNAGGAQRGVARRIWRLLIWAGVALLVALALLYAALWGYRFAVSQLGPFAPLAAFFVGTLVLVIAGPWLLIRYRRALRRLIVRVASLLWALIQATGLLRWFGARFPRLSRFLGGRLIPGTATGLGLTIGLAAAFAALVYVIELMAEVLFGTKVVAIDRRILNLIATMRTPTLDEVMYAASYLGNARTVVILLAAALIMTLLARRWLDTVLLILAPVAAELFMAILKLLVHRPRPPLEDARIVDSGFSFPSGHATLAATFYGVVAFLLIVRARPEWLKALIGVGAAIIVFAVGVSRVYLGAHYSTDVMAGWALGIFWLVVVVLVDHITQQPTERLRPVNPVRPPRRAGAIARQVISFVVMLVAVGVAAYTYRDIPPAPVAQPEPSILVDASQVPQVVQTRLPHFTETLTGKPQEPMSIVLVGNRSTVEQAFKAAGWTEAARFGFQSVAGGIGAAISRRPDAAGPVTPSFYAEEPNTLAFSLPVGKTFAQRHHIRVWSTDYKTTDGADVWLATASYDQGFELAHTTFMPTHQIAPNIDAERAFVVASLTQSGVVTQQSTIQLTAPEQGHNFSGDPFYTDGQAIILYLS